MVDLLDNCLRDLDLGRRDRYGFTGLHYAVKYRLKDSVTKLCKAMAKFNLSVDLVNKDGDTSYIVAKRSQYFDIMDILVNIGNSSPT